MSPSGTADLLVGEGICSEISAMENPVLRNLRITQSYADLSAGLGRHIGIENANWCSFATWASKEAGNFIRNEEVPAPMRRALEARMLADVGEAPHPGGGGSGRLNRLMELNPIIGMVGFTTEDVSKHIAAGNLKVYAELAPIFSRFVEMLDAADGQPRGGDVAQFMGALTPGPTAEGGQGPLLEAFGAYLTALRTADPNERAEHILMANALIGLHEQTRLQEAIESALVAPFERLRASRSKILAKAPSRLKALGQKIKGKGLDPADQLQARWLKVCTRFMMTLALPNRVLNLGVDVPSLDDGSAFPAVLDRLGLEPAQAIYRRFSRVREALAGSAAQNWADLDDRMNYIVNLFRSRHAAPELYAPPFGVTQTEAIRAGRMPVGALGG